MGDEKERLEWPDATSEGYFYENLPDVPKLAYLELVERIVALADDPGGFNNVPIDFLPRIAEGVAALGVWKSNHGELAWRHVFDLEAASEESPDVEDALEEAYNWALAESEGFSIEFDRRKLKQDIKQYSDKYRAAFSGALYELDEPEVKRIQALTNQLRDLVTASEDFEEKHRRRILDRIEKLQAELNHKMSNLDRFWGLIGDAGVAVGKFGTNAKPFVDLIREIAEIIWKVQARDAELPEPGGLPQLGGSEEGD